MHLKHNMHIVGDKDRVYKVGSREEAVTIGVSQESKSRSIIVHGSKAPASMILGCYRDWVLRF